MTGDVVEGVWSVLFDPDYSSVYCVVRWQEKAYHGRVSCSSTGKFAALLLPFSFELDEN